MNKNIENNQMGTLEIRKLAFKLSIPMVISMISIALYGIIDTMFISKINNDAIAAVALSIPIQSIITGIGLGTSIGINALLAKKLGEKNIEKSNQVIQHGFILILISWILIAIINYIGLNYFFDFFTENINIKKLGLQYLSITGFLCIGSLYQILLEKILEAYGKVKLSLIVQFSGAIINLILDPILIFGYFNMPAMGIRGAAISTVLGQLFGMAIGIVILLKEKIVVLKEFLKFKFQKEIIIDIYKVGFPTIVLECLTSFITLILNRILSGFSDDAISVWGIYCQLQKFVIIIIYGFNYAMIPIIAYNYGAKNKERIFQTINMFMKMTITVTLIGTFTFLVMPKQLISIYNVSESVLNMAIPAFRILSISFAFIGIGLVFGSISQALGNGTYGLIINICRQIIIPLPLMLVLKNMLNLNGVWISITIGAIVTSYLALILYKKIKESTIYKIESTLKSAK